MLKCCENLSKKEREATFMRAVASNISLEGHTRTAKEFSRRAAILERPRPKQPSSLRL